LNDERDILVEEHLQVLRLQILDFKLSTAVLRFSDEHVAGRGLQLLPHEHLLVASILLRRRAAVSSNSVEPVRHMCFIKSFEMSFNYYFDLLIFRFVSEKSTSYPFPENSIV
jgi:hypothetical protein